MYTFIRRKKKNHWKQICLQQESLKVNDASIIMKTWNVVTAVKQLGIRQVFTHLASYVHTQDSIMMRALWQPDNLNWAYFFRSRKPHENETSFLTTLITTTKMRRNNIHHVQENCIRPNKKQTKKQIERKNYTCHRNHSFIILIRWPLLGCLELRNPSFYIKW